MPMYRSCCGLALCALVLAACATTPPPPPTNALTVTTASPPLASPISPEYLAKRYRTRKRGNTVVYCRYEVPTGSNMRSELCLTEQQLQREIAATQNVIDAMRQHPSNRPRAPVRRN